MAVQIKDNKVDVTKLMPIVQQFQGVRREIEGFVFERKDIIKMALIAIMAKEHMLLIGPPGVAKSMIINQITQRIQGASLFEILMHSMVTEKDLFVSSVSTEQEAKGSISSFRTVYHTDGATLGNSLFAFLDEIYKSNEKTRDSLLQLMNERKYSLNKKLYTSDMMAMFFASNELPETDGTDGAAAFHDRILIRANIRPISDPANRMKVFKTQLAHRRNTVLNQVPNRSMMKIADIRTLQNAVPLVYVPTEVMERLVDLKEKVSQDLEIYISDRRLERTLTLLQARALLDGRNEVERGDLTLARFVFWTDTDHYDKVESLVRNNVLTPEERRLRDIKSAAFELVQAAQKTISDGDLWSIGISEEMKGIQGCLQELNEIKQRSNKQPIKNEAQKLLTSIVTEQKELLDAQSK